jgi:hypothetical protein
VVDERRWTICNWTGSSIENNLSSPLTNFSILKAHRTHYFDPSLQGYLARKGEGGREGHLHR